ncbi:MAG: endonuclease V [Candidatus Bathyarchaeota archaeon]|nr:endonuclease V [Candidatus Bathyarchaeota archaeon]
MRRSEYLNFYEELRRLLDQVPDDAYTTILELSQAMGDPISAPAIRDSLLRSDFQRYADKVNERSHPFASFQTVKPLLRLAEKQVELAKLVVEEDMFGNWEKIAGVDAAYVGDHAYAACVVVDRSGSVVSEGSAEYETCFPYIPGYFYFREGPALVAAVRGLDYDILMVNAHGVAHPRRLGLASQLGLELGKPTLGVSTGLLVGEVKRRREGISDVFLDSSLVGVRLDGRPPLLVSVGHMISLGNAVSIVDDFWSEIGLPRPLALAHEHARK